MNSLEFIQQQIANCNEQIDLCYERINENSLYKTLVEHYSQTINELKELKQRLEQIKSELEAWYDIKDLYKKGYFSRISLPIENHEKIKRALEV